MLLIYKDRLTFKKIYGIFISIIKIKGVFDTMKEIDMMPYEEYFTELERVYFEKNARLNIVAYMSDSDIFTKEQYDRVFNDYVESLKNYEDYINVFEENVVIPVCGTVIWKADFKRRVIYVE